MGRRLLCTIASFAMLAGLLFIGRRAPAHAATPNERIAVSIVSTLENPELTDAANLRLVFGDKSADCFAGPIFDQFESGETRNLLACVFDESGNPASTTEADGGFLEWSIDHGADDDVDTQYFGVAPTETDTEGEAVALVEAIDVGTDFPGVCLREDDTGDPLSCDSVQVNVVHTDKSFSNVSISHRKGPHRFKGTVISPDDVCEPGRTVVVKRRVPGPDASIGSDVTNAAGNYKVRHRKSNGKKSYYAKATGNADCLSHFSRVIRRR